MGKQVKEKSKKNLKTILVVDDEVSITSSFSFFLEDYSVVLANTVESAWDAYKKATPDLIITDIILQGLTGIDLLKKIRENDNKTPVIIITGYASIVTATEAFKEGADDYLHKPIRTDNLLNMIKKHIEIKRSNPEIEIIRIRKLNEYLLKENETLKKELKPCYDRGKMVAENYKYIIGAITHSLNNELSHIEGWIELIWRDSKYIEKGHDIIERSLQYSHLLLRRLNNYLDIGKPTLEIIDITEVLKRTEMFIRPRLPSHIDMKIDYNFGEALTEIDAEQLMGVLIELIQNAIHALGQNGGNIGIHLEDRNGEIALSVKDNASGIPEQVRADLFNKEVKSKKGLGIGLFLCSKVISGIGGKLLLEETSEKGTTFTILLPKASDKKEP